MNIYIVALLGFLFGFLFIAYLIAKIIIPLGRNIWACEIEIFPGTDITTAIEDAMKLSFILGCTVEFVFNEIELEVHHSFTVDEVVSTYYRLRKINAS